MIELFYVWCINFMVLLVSSQGTKNIVVVVDYVSKWVEVIALLKKGRIECNRILEKEYLLQIWQHLGPLLVMVDLTSVISYSKGYWRNMGFAIMCLPLIIYRRVGKLRCSIETSSKF